MYAIDCKFHEPPDIHDLDIKPQKHKGAPIDLDASMEWEAKPELKLAFKLDGLGVGPGGGGTGVGA